MHFSFLDSITAKLPLPSRKVDAAHALEKWGHIGDIEKSLAGSCSAIKNHKQGAALLNAIFGNSPFLTQIVLKHPKWFIRTCETSSEKTFADLCRHIKNTKIKSIEQLMQLLRIAKREASLIAAMADIASIWNVQDVTKNLSLFAEIVTMKTAEWLLSEAHRKGDIALPYPEDSARDSGWIILAMGKLGARELNYSSDIDLILLFDKDRINYIGDKTLQHLMSKLTQELVSILNERTADGYVFRTDIRLRPDPASTPACMSVNAAMTYYETVGQNWERAALIKARPIGGDIYAGYEFLKRLSPFIWRKYLDFVAIDDIQSIKRQMDAYHQSALKIEGHNIKIGIGGIREIEFYAQIHQLIWGGRMPQLRSLMTCETLPQLAKENLISPEIATHFTQIYWFLRTVEHRLQMIHDHQTHSIPETPEEIERIAIFMGFDGIESFRSALIRACEYVHDIYTHSFKGQGKLGTEGKLVFTGVEADPGTIENLTKMGFGNPVTVCEVIAGWHRGSRRATRNKRARELITEVTPIMLKAFAASANPDQAFIHFDEFVAKLPAGVQIFSLFHNNPSLLELIATIMGSAPAMADTLARYPNLLDSVLTGQFYEQLPDRTLLLMEFSNFIFHARDYEDEVGLIRQFKNEKHFQAGIQLLTGKINHIIAGEFLSQLADIILLRILKITTNEFTKSHGVLGDDSMAVVALGKLGAQELTFGSDLDLVFIYEAALEDTSSDGEKSLSPNVYFGRLCQRFIGALTSLAREGRLFEVDMRLRPSGNQGPIAVSVDAFNKYFTESAWTFERMALTKARVISGGEQLKSDLMVSIQSHLSRTPDKESLKHDIRSLRVKVEEEFGSDNIWDLKYARGGLMDIDFIAQYLVLQNAYEKPEILRTSTLHILESAKKLGVLDSDTLEKLLKSHHFLSQLFYLLRLCSDGRLQPEQAPSGLMRLLVHLTKSEDFGQLQKRITETLSLVNGIFNKLFA